MHRCIRNADANKKTEQACPTRLLTSLHFGKEHTNGANVCRRERAERKVRKVRANIQGALVRAASASTIRVHRLKKREREKRGKWKEKEKAERDARG